MNKSLQYHQARALKQILIQQALDDPDMLGEALLKYSFIGEGRGCYSNFKLCDSFEPYPDGKQQFKDDLLGYGYAEDGEEEEEVARIQSFVDKTMDLIVVWFWDHDGHLIFKLGDVVLENTDVKKSYNWRFV